MSLEEKVVLVGDRCDLVKVIEALRVDLNENPSEWVNQDLGGFLEALSAWVNDMDGFFLGRGLDVPKSPTWKNIAEMLVAAKYYE